MGVEDSVKSGAKLVNKFYKILWLITIIGFIGTLGGFYLEFRKLNDNVARVQVMINTLGEQLVGVSKWKDKAGSELDKLKEQSGNVGDLLKKGVK